MLGNIILFLKKILIPNRKIQTFTYYVPSPPKRKFGYREKEFDRAVYQFINRGYKIINIQAIQNNGVDYSGMWVIFTVKSLNRRADKLDLDLSINLEDDLTTENSHNLNEIEGIEYIDD